MTASWYTTTDNLTSSSGGYVTFTTTGTAGSKLSDWARMGAITTVGSTDYRLTSCLPSKETMNVPKASPIPCPKCGGRAIRDQHGNDAVYTMHDHDESKDEDCTGDANGNLARIRACSKCGNVWAGIVRVTEA